MNPIRNDAIMLFRHAAPDIHEYARKSEDNVRLSVLQLVADYAAALTIAYPGTELYLAEGAPALRLCHPTDTIDIIIIPPFSEGEPLLIRGQIDVPRDTHYSAILLSLNLDQPPEYDSLIRERVALISNRDIYVLDSETSRED